MPWDPEGVEIIETFLTLNEAVEAAWGRGDRLGMRAAKAARKAWMDHNEFRLSTALHLLLEWSEARWP